MNTQPTFLKGVWLIIARLAWVILLVLNLGLTIISLPKYTRNILSLVATGMNFGGAGSMWTPANLNAALTVLHLSPTFLVVSHLTLSAIQLLIFWTIGLLIFWRKSDTWLGLFASFVLIGIGLTSLGSATISLALIPLPWRFFVDLAATLVWPAFFLFLILFPDGRFVPRWTRFLVPIWIIIWVVTEAATIFDYPKVESLSFLLVFPLAIISVASQVYRYLYASGPVERQQTKWFMFAIGFLIVAGTIIQYLVFVPLIRFLGPGSPTLLLDVVYQVLFLAIIMIIPCSIAFAIFRYRLWDIDLIIRKTFTFGVLTITLGLVFFSGVALLQQMFVRLGGVENSPVAIVVSTLAIAALFNPLRIRIQNSIDRRFYRSKYDAQKMLERFAATARNEVELDQITEHLILVVKETMQPNMVTLWLRPYFERSVRPKL